MNTRSQPDQASRLTPNSKSRPQMAQTQSVSAQFFKPQFVYQNASIGMERHTYIKSYN